MQVLRWQVQSDGTFVVVRQNGSEYRLWRYGYFAPDTPTAADRDEVIAWATPHVTKIATQDAEKATRETNARAALDDPNAFLVWVKQNRTRGDIRPLLKELARLYAEETD